MNEFDKDKIEVTDIWAKYEKSRDYLQKKGLVSATDKAWNFYLGDQWVGLKSGNETLPTMNIIKPIVKYKVATISQNTLTAHFSDADAEDESVNQGIYKMLNQKFSQSWEKAKMAAFSWRSNKAAAVQGESYTYFGTGDTNDEPQLIANTSILLGDENIENIQEQPYIIIRERLRLRDVKESARMHGIPEEEISTIYTDNETQDELYNRDEVSDKVTSLLYMTKIDGIVNVAKSTRSCIYEPLRPLSNERNGMALGGLTTYPVVVFKWEYKPNSARGMGEVETLIPNQLEINKTLARRAMAVKLAAFPRIAYDATAIENPEDLTKVGKAIGVTTGNAQSVNQAIAYLNAANISSDADKLFNDLIVQTQELVGAGDNALGNVNPERASGQAIIAVRDQAQLPLNEQLNSYRQWVEDIAMLWFDMWATFSPNDFTFTEDVEVPSSIDGEMTTIPQEVTLSYEEFVALKPTVRIDVSEDNKWTKLSEQQSIDNLLEKQQISFEEYVELCSDDGPIPKGKLLAVVNNRRQMQADMEEQQLADENAAWYAEQQAAQPPM